MLPFTTGGRRGRSTGRKPRPHDEAAELMFSDDAFGFVRANLPFDREK